MVISKLSRLFYSYNQITAIKKLYDLKYYTKSKIIRENMRAKFLKNLTNNQQGKWGGKQTREMQREGFFFFFKRRDHNRKKTNLIPVRSLSLLFDRNHLILLQLLLRQLIFFRSLLNWLQLARPLNISLHSR